MDIKKNFGFLRQIKEDVYIEEAYLLDAMQDDVVIVDDNKHLPKVVEIVSRGLSFLVCQVVIHNEHTYLEPTKTFNQLLVVDIDKNLVDGHIVLVEIDEITSLHIKGHITEIVGHRNDPDIETKKIVSSYHWPSEFSSKVYDELKTLSHDIPNTLDFANKLIITIDGEDAKDLDDAIHLEVLEDGYELGVHIADVSYFVKPNTSLDEEAFSRSTSVYLANKVIPMLPHILSNDVCSLNPNEAKKTLSIVMKVNHKGDVVSHYFRSSVIQSSHRLTYTEVNRYLKGKISLDNKPLELMLSHLNMLSKTLERKRYLRGEMNFHTDELYFVMKDDIVSDVYIRNQDEAEKLIESMMLLANETVAKHLADEKITAVYRIHDVPDMIKMQQTLKMIKQLGIQVPKDNITDPKNIQEVIRRSQNSPFRDIIHMIMLRAMQKASYEVDLSEHFGLGASHYTHFTSPIRRYPDLIVHRLIHMYILKDMKVEPMDMFHIANHTSKQERLALVMEREVISLKSCEYLLNQPKKVYEAMIIHTMARGMFVKIENGIEGFVSLKSIPSYIKYYEDTMTYADRRGILYRLGDKITVELVKVDIDTRKIDFKILNRKKRR
jgi:ribonuclease R